MNKNIETVPTVLTSLSISTFSDDINGNLIIVGGGLADNNKEIYNDFINMAGGKKAKIGIVPTASSNLKSTINFKENLINYGMSADNISIIKVAKHDFKRMDDNEFDTWAGNENNDKIAKKIHEMDGIWFVGGDQSRVITAFYNEDGSKSKALEAIWSIYRKGAVLGGTSAGAAIMSEKMICGGDSIGALKKGMKNSKEVSAEFESNGVLIKDGFGFFPHGIIDQHYDKRARLARTIVADLYVGEKNQMAFGIDENTALIYKARKNEIEFAGEGHVTVIDNRSTKFISEAPATLIKNIKISLLSKNDKLKPAVNEINIYPSKKLTTGYEYVENKLPIATGALSSYGLLKDYLAYGLVDNKEAKMATTYSFEEDGLGFQFDFKKLEDTKGFYDLRNNRDNYSMENIYLNITPIEVEIKKY